jgi:alanyl-tRNA synthetase
MARERGLTVDIAGFESLMEQQRARARAAQKREVIALSEVDGSQSTIFTGFEAAEAEATVLQVVRAKDKLAVVLDQTPCFAEMGGQVGDQAVIHRGDRAWGVLNTVQSGLVRLHLVDGDSAPEEGSRVSIAIDAPRRLAIERHHTATHLLHWALHRVVSPDATQKGSSVTPEKLTFDFNSSPLTPDQIDAVERLVNERILENAVVSWSDFPYDQVKGRADIMQFFGDRYGDMVRVVQIGGEGRLLNGYSMELCGGTHVRSTGQIGLFRITSEAAVAAGIRRIEAVTGLAAWHQAVEGARRLEAVAARLNAPLGEIERKIDSLLEHSRNLEKSLKAAQVREADAKARELIGATEPIGGIPSIIAHLGSVDGDFLQAVLESLKGRFEGIVVLAGHGGDAVALAASVSPTFLSRFQAGKIIQTIAPLVGGKGGGKLDQARGGGRQVDKIPDALARAKSFLSESC